MQENLIRLKEWIGDTELIDDSEKPIFAMYDPPWTPSCVRRNEVMIKLMEK